MTCSEYLDLAAAHVDGELTPDELTLAEAHIAACANCAAVRAAQVAVRTQLRRPGLQVHTPGPLAESVSAAIEGRRAAHTSGGAWSRRALLVGTIAAGLALLVLPRRWRRSPDLLKILSLDVKAANAGTIPLAIETGDLDEVRRYYRETGQLPFDASVADLSKADFQVQGGTVLGIGELPATYTVYRRGTERILCRRFALGSLPMPPGGEPLDVGRLYNVDGVSAWIHNDRDATCCLVTTMPTSEFRRALRACGAHA